MTEPTPTPKKQNPSAAPDENTSPPEERDGFFRRVQRVLKPEPESRPVHPSEEQEIVVNLTPIKKTNSDEQS
jgi:hypothetical protein